MIVTRRPRAASVRAVAGPIAAIRASIAVRSAPSAAAVSAKKRTPLVLVNTSQS